jgi:hypothetical protein
MAININKSLGDFHLSICPKPGPYQDELPAKALDNRLPTRLENWTNSSTPLVVIKSSLLSCPQDGTSLRKETNPPS